MVYLLDTNAVSDLIRENEKVAAKLSALPRGDTAIICSIVKGECLFGIKRLPDGARKTAIRQKMELVLSSLRCEPVPETAADHYALIKRQCQKNGTPLDEADLWIAATALALAIPLVTRDQAFHYVDGLSIQDWTQ